MPRKNLRITWALDAFEDSPEVFENSIRLLKGLSAQLSAEIEPVYVLGPKQLNLPVDFSQTIHDTYFPAAIKSISHRVKAIPLTNLRPPHVVVNRYSSLRESASLLLSHAESTGSQLIVTGTHGRKGVSRVLLGSFAEELMLQSKIPVVVIGSQEPMLPKDERIRRILFPTDFREEAFPVFRRVTELAQNLDASIEILHAIPKPFEPAIQSGVFLASGAWLPSNEFAIEEKSARESAERVAKEWMARAGVQSTSIQVTIDSGMVSVTSAILEVAAARPSTLIAMAAQSGRFSSVVLGSIARQVVREAAFPVWICRTSH